MKQRRRLDYMPPTQYAARKEAGLCTQCGVPAADDSQYCDLHAMAHRLSANKYDRKMARKRRRSKVCYRCGRTRRAGRRICLKCEVMRRSIEQQILVGSGSDVPPDKSERIALMTRTHADGRTRYHGQGKRGNQPRGQLNRQDLGYARKAFDSGCEGVAMLESEEVLALPRIQRDDVRSAACHQLNRAIGHIEDVLERCGHFKAERGKDGG